ncbi:MAG TPA: hypothetical protein VFV92_11075 [Candidatus Bathyarchaeia archaeon]|nr:hypothetical protein [Candidatus Bathyarchaeia archaeon]
MESTQVQIVNEDVLDLGPHMIGADPCVICGSPTTFRYGSIPLCPACAEQRRL